MRDGSLSRKGGARYSKLATDDDDYVAPKTGPRFQRTRSQLREAGHLKTYIDNLDHPDNEVFQRFFQTTIYVAMLWASAFYYLYPWTRPYIIVAFCICCLIAIKITWM
jgi:hypothetical protein|eukprot:COSAG06_NODE_15634_length_1056_cov_2.022989_2_plen_108_part_00